MDAKSLQIPQKAIEATGLPELAARAVLEAAAPYIVAAALRQLSDDTELIGDTMWFGMTDMQLDEIAGQLDGGEI